MTTIYVLGAGASLHAGFPLASAMGEGLLDCMLRYPTAAYPSAAQFLIDTFGKSPNIEDLITTLQSRIDALNTPEGKAERMRHGARTCICRVRREDHSARRCSYHFELR